MKLILKGVAGLAVLVVAFALWEGWRLPQNICNAHGDMAALIAGQEFLAHGGRVLPEGTSAVREKDPGCLWRVTIRPLAAEGGPPGSEITETWPRQMLVRCVPGKTLNDVPWRCTVTDRP